jgi:hypothetical protein
LILEALTWLATPCEPAAKRLGYLTAAIGLQARARRCRKAWAPHIEQSLRAVRESLELCPSRGIALVLGSGLGLEYSLAELAAEFEQVILADVVHLPALRRAARRHGNVELLPIDLSGVVARLATLPINAENETLARLDLTPPGLQALGADWVLSANILSQLPQLPITWLESHCPAIDDHTREAFGHRLMTQHLEWLKSFNAHCCLIADAEQTVFDAQGRVIEHTNLARPLGLDKHAYASWEWTLAPKGELQAGLNSRHRMVACHWPAK